MKQSGFLKGLPLAAVAAALLLAGRGNGLAQVPGGANTMNAAMLKLFGSNTAFSAKAEFRILGKGQQVSYVVPASYAFLDGKWRMEIDFGQVKGAQMPEQYVATMK